MTEPCSEIIQQLREERAAAIRERDAALREADAQRAEAKRVSEALSKRNDLSAQIDFLQCLLRDVRQELGHFNDAERSVIECVRTLNEDRNTTGRALALMVVEREGALKVLRDCVLRLRSHGVNAHDGECTCRRQSVTWPCSCGLDAVLGLAEAKLQSGG